MYAIDTIYIDCSVRDDFRKINRHLIKFEMSTIGKKKYIYIKKTPDELLLYYV